MPIVLQKLSWITGTSTTQKLDRLVNAVATLLDVKDLPDESFDEDNPKYAEARIADNTLMLLSGIQRAVI